MNGCDIMVLMRTRQQVGVVRRLEEAMERESMLRSVRLDGMPRGKGGVPNGLDVQVARRDAMERILERERRQLRQYEREAQRALAHVRPEHYMFCAIYYIDGLSLEDTAKMIDRSVRQCQRYKRDLERLALENGAAGAGTVGEGLMETGAAAARAHPAPG